MKQKLFLIHSSDIFVRRLVMQESSCEGKFCNRQNNAAKEEGRKPCGCCSTSSNCSCLIASVTFAFSNPSVPGEKMTMVNFTSLQFQNAFAKGHLAQNIRTPRSQGTKNCREIQSAFSSVISLINQNGG